MKKKNTKDPPVSSESSWTFGPETLNQRFLNQKRTNKKLGEREGKEGRKKEKHNTNGDGGWMKRE